MPTEFKENSEGSPSEIPLASFDAEGPMAGTLGCTHCLADMMNLCTEQYGVEESQQLYDMTIPDIQAACEAFPVPIAVSQRQARGKGYKVLFECCTSPESHLGQAALEFLEYMSYGLLLI